MTVAQAEVRDGERQRTYDAEFDFRFIMDNSAQTSGVITIAGSTLVLPVERKFGTIESAQDFCNRVCAKTNMPPVKVRVRRGQTKAHYESGTANHPAYVIALPVLSTWALREIVALHELAHHATRSVRRGGAHGPAFRAAFLRLLEAVMGYEAAFIMRVLFTQQGLSQ